MRLGIDFDNTIASYDELMHSTAVHWGLIDPGLRKNKKIIRDALRSLPDGENHWRRLQTYSYGEGMTEARPMDGVKDMLTFCVERQIPVCIISHKTEFNNFGPPTVNLRQAATNWLQLHGFFEYSLTGLAPDRVYFESTLESKVGRISKLAPTHFIDDLEETFLVPSFPVNIQKILFAPHGETTKVTDALVCRKWSDIHRYFEAAQIEGNQKASNGG